jgi:hypothetical protein
VSYAERQEINSLTGLPVAEVLTPPSTDFDPARWLREEVRRRARVQFASELAVTLHGVCPQEVVLQIYFEACWETEAQRRARVAFAHELAATLYGVLPQEIIQKIHHAVHWPS